VAYSPFSDKKESGLRIITVEDLENLRRKDRVWTIIKREGNDWKSCLDSIRNVGGESLKHAEKYHWLCPKYEQNDCDEYAYQERHFDLSIRDTGDYS
jgi:hypothetical protein